MKLGNFVTTSAVVLAGWLGFTFVHEVPSQRYPKHQRYTDARSRMITPPNEKPVEAAPEPEVFHVSLSQ
jgi:hypothetical protein